MVTPQTPGVPDHAKKSGPVEKKVKAGALWVYLGGVALLALVNAFTGNDNELLLATLPDVVEPFVLPLVPTVLSFVGGFVAKHTPRPDLGA